jgi:3-methyladenine DNA glycosylase AlkD
VTAATARSAGVQPTGPRPATAPPTAPGRTEGPAAGADPEVVRLPGDASDRGRSAAEDRRPAAERLGAELADLVGDPAAFTTALISGLEALAEPEYRAGTLRVAPGIGPVLGVRQGLQSTVQRVFARRARGISPSSLLSVADAMLRTDVGEVRWFAIDLSTRIFADEPERAWQLLRRAAREAGEWITVDTLAHAYGRGILLETYRWAELEQLVYSPSRWERRLVGSSVATIPFVDRHAGREPAVARRGLALVGELIGDAEPDVQKALSWALRNLTLVDREAVARFCIEETDRAVETDDGLRAWVVRDSLAKLEPSLAAALRDRLAGIRRRPGAASTSRASEVAAAFGTLPDPRATPEPPL